VALTTILRGQANLLSCLDLLSVLLQESWNYSAVITASSFGIGSSMPFPLGGRVHQEMRYVGKLFRKGDVLVVSHQLPTFIR
jgi:hypothetical protein